MADFLGGLGGFLGDVFTGAVGAIESAIGVDIPFIGPTEPRVGEEGSVFQGPPSPFPESPVEAGTEIGGFLGDIAAAVLGSGLRREIDITPGQGGDRPDREPPPITQRREETIPPPGERDLGDLGALLARGLGIPTSRGEFPDAIDEAIMQPQFEGGGGAFRGVGASSSFEGGTMADLVASGPRASVALRHGGPRLPHRVQVRHPVTGRPVTYENMGAPILFSGHLRAARKVRKVAALARRKSR